MNKVLLNLTDFNYSKKNASQPTLVRVGLHRLGSDQIDSGQRSRVGSPRVGSRILDPRAALLSCKADCQTRPQKVRSDYSGTKGSNFKTFFFGFLLIFFYRCVIWT